MKELNQDQKELKNIVSMALLNAINIKPHDRNTIISIIRSEEHLMRKLETEQETKD